MSDPKFYPNGVYVHGFGPYRYVSEPFKDVVCRIASLCSCDFSFGRLYIESELRGVNTGYAFGMLDVAAEGSTPTK